MRKITLILSLLVTMVSTAMAGDIVVSTQEGSPEKVFTIKSGNNVYVGADAAPGDGRFAFFAVFYLKIYYFVFVFVVTVIAKVFTIRAFVNIL